MKSKACFLGVFLFVFCVFINCFQSNIQNELRINEEIPVEVMRLSKKVLVLTDVSPNGVVTAISTNKGIVVIDTGVSWSFGKGFREIIEHEFKRKEIIYVINTHADRDHTFGNQAFEEALIVGQKNCLISLENLKKEWNITKEEYISLHKGRAERSKKELKGIGARSDHADVIRKSIAANNLIASDLSEGQEIILPQITFTDQMTIYCGEITLYLYYLGEGHSDCDILIHVPQENLIVVGDAFIKSMLICYMKQDRFDMERYLHILNTVLKDKNQIINIVCGHGPMMTCEELLARRNYFESLLKGIKESYARDLNIEMVIQRLPLDNYSYLTRLIGKNSAELADQHIQIIGKYWKFLVDSEPYKN